ncbi:MAG: type II toxin-antitoxin system VapC family toxin [Desulfamplus sp.]|nr:type II toxin-antitoxin system VapC family toxin [Desulfamplus sp.]
MKLLLDTHTFIWWDSEPSKLPSKVLASCQNKENTLIISVASVWEMQIKSQLGKMKLSLPLEELIGSQNKINKIKILPIILEHILALEKLPSYHKDPFDRLLIAQANTENATLVSCDSVFNNYSVSLMW